MKTSKKRSLKRMFQKMTLAAVVSATAVFAAVPRTSEITNDTAIYQDLHELNVKKIKNVNFDSDIKRLSAREKRYHEALPTRITGPMDRINNVRYKSSAKKRSY